MTRAAIEGQYFLLVRKCERRDAIAQYRWNAIVVVLFCVAIFLCTYLGLVRRLGRSFFSKYMFLGVLKSRTLQG